MYFLNVSSLIVCNKPLVILNEILVFILAQQPPGVNLIKYFGINLPTLFSKLDDLFIKMP
jgi:hypothetical protein